MKFVPHEYQRFCLQKIIDTKKVGIWQDMGLGKTSDDADGCPRC